MYNSYLLSNAILLRWEKSINVMFHVIHWGYNIILWSAELGLECFATTSREPLSSATGKDLVCTPEIIKSREREKEKDS